MSTTAPLPEALLSMRTKPLFRLVIHVPQLLVVGPTPDALRRVGVIDGGSFTGDRLSGAVVSGIDWQAVRPDNCTTLDARLVLRTTDDALIAMSYQALRFGPPEIMQKLTRGEPVDPASCYFRLTALFETAASQYDWINRILAVGSGHRLAEGPLYNLFEIL